MFWPVCSLRVCSGRCDARARGASGKDEEKLRTPKGAQMRVGEFYTVQGAVRELGCRTGRCIAMWGWRVSR